MCSTEVSNNSVCSRSLHCTRNRAARFHGISLFNKEIIMHWPHAYTVQTVCLIDVPNKDFRMLHQLCCTLLHSRATLFWRDPVLQIKLFANSDQLISYHAGFCAHGVMANLFGTVNQKVSCMWRMMKRLIRVLPTLPLGIRLLFLLDTYPCSRADAS